MAQIERLEPFERPLPYDIHAERATLGSLLLERDAILVIAPWLQAEYFYLQKHEWIYEAVLACYNRRVPPDLSTVADDLRRRGRLDMVGGIIYLSELCAEVPTAVHVEYYARIVERTAIFRRLIEAGGKITAIGYDEAEELEDALDKAEAELFSVSQRRATQDFVHISTVIGDYFEQVNDLHERRGEVVGIPTGYFDLDKLTGGLQRSDLIILAARPSVGKTSMALSIAYNVGVKRSQTVAIFSLEMSREQLVQRLLAMHTGIDMQRMRTGSIDRELHQVMEGMGVLSAAPVYIEDTPALSITEVRSRARRLQAQVGIDLVVVDYLQLMQGRRTDNRVQEVSEVSRGLKALARELDVPVLALSQLSRAVEGRTSRVPMLSDLRESGCLTGDTQIYLPDEGGYRRIDQLVGSTGFHVLAVDPETWKLEPRKVLNSFATGTKQVDRMTTRLGRTIRATANHTFLTPAGWKRLDALLPGDHIAVPRTLPATGRDALPHTELALRGHTNRDTIPCDVWRQCVVPAMQPRHTTSRHMQATRGTASCGTGRDTRGLSRERAKRGAVTVQADEVLSLAQSDVYWDEIISIQPDTIEEVYDLTVEGLHNFVADNIIVHNSLEQDADIVVFIYREELYDKETDKQGIAELHIAKHRNGPLGIVPLRFAANTTSFQNLARRPASES